MTIWGPFSEPFGDPFWTPFEIRSGDRKAAVLEPQPLWDPIGSEPDPSFGPLLGPLFEPTFDLSRVAFWGPLGAPGPNEKVQFLIDFRSHSLWAGFGRLWTLQTCSCGLAGSL